MKIWVSWKTDGGGYKVAIESDGIETKGEIIKAIKEIEKELLRK